MKSAACAERREELLRDASARLEEWYRERGLKPWKLEHVGKTPTTLSEPSHIRLVKP